MPNIHSIQGLHKIMVGLKAYTEENLVWEKEQNMFYLLEKHKNFTWLCDI